MTGILKDKLLKKYLLILMICFLVELCFDSAMKENAVELSSSFIFIASFMGIEFENITLILNRKQCFKVFLIMNSVAAGLLVVLGYISQIAVTTQVTLFGFYHLTLSSASYGGLFLFSLSAFNFVTLTWLLMKRRSFTLVILPLIIIVAEFLVPYLFLSNLTKSTQSIVFSIYLLSLIGIQLLELNYYTTTTRFDHQIDSKFLRRRYFI